MKICCGFSVFLTVALILFGIGPRKYVSAEEKSPEKRGHRFFDPSLELLSTMRDDLTSFLSPWMFHDYFRPWRHWSRLTKDMESIMKTDKDKFQVNLDVQHFRPEEISVKTVDGHVVIEARHEEKQDEHGYVSRHLVRKYALPEGTEEEEVVSQLSSDGVLTVSAPRKDVPVKGERVVPITPTGPVRKESKESKNSAEGSCPTNDQSCGK